MKSVKEVKQVKRMGRAKAIRLKCIDCSGGSLSEVRLCPVVDCPLYEYRMGNVANEDEQD